MKAFVDWARTKQVALVLDDDTEKIMTTKEFVDMFGKNDEIFLESGFSARLMYSVLDKGARVFRGQSQTIKSLREELGYPTKTSDIEDAHLIRATYGKYPELFIEVEKPSNEDRALRRLFTQYRQVTRDVARFKNIIQAHEWEFGVEEGYAGAIISLEQTKKDLLKLMKPYIKDDLKKFKMDNPDIKGVGVALIAQLLAIAHPKNFPSWSCYRAYVGYTARTFYKTFENGKGKGRGQFCRDAHAAVVLMAQGLIRAAGISLKSEGLKKEEVEGKAPRWEYEQIKEYIETVESPIPVIVMAWNRYYKIKERFHNENPIWSNGMCHGKAQNRLGTEILKQIYHSLKEAEQS